MGGRERSKPLNLMSLVTWSKLEQTTKGMCFQGGKQSPGSPLAPMASVLTYTCAHKYIPTKINDFKLKIRIRFYLL